METKELGLNVLQSMEVINSESDDQACLFANVEASYENCTKIMFLVFLAKMESEYPTILECANASVDKYNNVEEIKTVDITFIAFEFSEWFEDGMWFKEKPISEEQRIEEWKGFSPKEKLLSIGYTEEILNSLIEEEPDESMHDEIYIEELSYCTEN